MSLVQLRLIYKLNKKGNSLFSPQYLSQTMRVLRLAIIIKNCKLLLITNVVFKIQVWLKIQKLVKSKYQSLWYPRASRIGIYFQNQSVQNTKNKLLRSNFKELILKNNSNANNKKWKSKRMYI